MLTGPTCPYFGPRSYTTYKAKVTSPCTTKGQADRLTTHLIRFFVLQAKGPRLTRLLARKSRKSRCMYACMYVCMPAKPCDLLMPTQTRAIAITMRHERRRSGARSGARLPLMAQSELIGSLPRSLSRNLSRQQLQSRSTSSALS